MKFIQIAVSYDHDGEENLYALGDDGIVYYRRSEKQRGSATWLEWWEPLNYSVGKPQPSSDAL